MRSLQRNLGLLVVAITLIAMLALTWRTWPEPVIDFGRELYVPWQLSQGKVLYRDIAYFNGPLSPYFNSIVFRVLGVSMMKLASVNLAILIGILLMLHRLAARMSDEITATIACCAFLILLAIGQPGPVGNYNYLTPYSHEMTHGLALSLAAMLSMVRFIETRKNAWIAISGAMVGLVFLTKPEIFLAAGVAVSIGAMLATRESADRETLPPQKRLLVLALFAGCAASVVLIALMLLSIALPLHQAVEGLIGGWRWAMDSRITSNAFYQRVRGTFDLDQTLGYLLAMAVGYAILFALPSAIGWFLEGDRTQRARQMAVSFVITSGLLYWFWGFIKWEEVGRGLIFVLPICVIGASRGATDSRGILRLVFSIFALLMLAKTALNVRFYHYGFVLTAPAMIVSIAALLCWLPAWINHNGGSGAVLRGATLAALCFTAGTYLYYENLVARRKTTLVGANGDAFYTDGKGLVVNRILDRLKSIPPNATLAVVPQGVMINYLSRRENPTPFIVQMPPEVMMFSQGRMVESFAAHPPDYVVYLSADTTEYGFHGYTIDFGRPMFEWMEANYSPIDGDPPRWVLLARKVSADK